MRFGYARVSTIDQDHAAQVEQLNAAGAGKVFAEKVSGAKGDREQLRRAVEALDPGDLLLVTRIDRLARSTRDLLNIIHDVKSRGADFQSLAEPWANTDSPTATAMLTIISAVAELERDFIRTRTGFGRERAKARGRRMGRKPKLSAEQIELAEKMQAEGAGVREIGRVLSVDGSTVSRALRNRGTGQMPA